MQARIVVTLLVVVAVVSAAVAVAGNQAAEGVVNINTASLEELQLLPRIGPALAARIVEFRDTSGPFRSVEEIVAVKGIGEAAFKRLEPYITTSGATTLAVKVRSSRSTGGTEATD
jgi:competence protein ComEA